MAVYTEVSDTALNALLADYDIGESRGLKGIAEGVENSNYLLQTDKDRYILTLYEKRVSREDLPFFLGLKNHLAAKGISCPVPIARKDGGLLSEVAGRPAAIISFLNGKSVRRPTVTHCFELGKALASLHLAGQDFAMQRPNTLSLSGWQDLFAQCRESADDVHQGLAQTIETELTRLSESWAKNLSQNGGENLPSGIIHADLFVDNVFFIGEKLSGMIDFYFACTDMFAYDLAIVLNAWCFEADVNFNITKARALFEGYQSVRPLTGAEIDALPILASGASLRFLLTRLYDWLNYAEGNLGGALVKPKDPMDYLRRLRFHKKVTRPQDYGINLEQQT